MKTLFQDSLSESEFLYNPEGGANHCHSATLLETAVGDLLAVWYAYPEKENAGASLVLSIRRAGAKAWAPSRFVVESAAYSLGNPVLHQSPDGVIRLFYVALRSTWWDSAVLNVVVSRDGGQSWSRPASMGVRQGLMIRHPPVCLPNSDLLLPAYHEAANQTLLLKSAAPYQHWEEGHRFEQREVIQPVLLTDPKGNLDIFFRAASAPARMWRSSSKDQGRTWEAPVITELVNPLSGIAAVTANGILAVVHNPIENQRTPLAVSLSPNSGRSWTGTFVLDSAKLEVSYPSFLLGRDRMVRGVYTFNRRMIKYVAFPVELLSHATR